MESQLSIELTPAMLAMVPLVAAVLQMFKNLPLLETYKRYFPIAALALGIGAAFLQGFPNPILVGIVIGLTAAGSYDVLKGKTIEGKNEVAKV